MIPERTESYCRKKASVSARAVCEMRKAGQCEAMRSMELCLDKCQAIDYIFL